MNLLPIPNCPGYFASSNGEVYSSWKRFRKPRGYGTFCKLVDGFFFRLKPRKNDDGYLEVSVKSVLKKNRRHGIHQLVLISHGFPKPTPLHQVRHLNGVRDDNRIENLKWGTAQENGHDCALHGTLKGTKNPAAKLDPEKVVAIYESAKPYRALAKDYRVGTSSISRIKKRTHWRHVLHQN